MCFKLIVNYNYNHHSISLQNNIKHKCFVNSFQADLMYFHNQSTVVYLYICTTKPKKKVFYFSFADIQ